MIMKPVKQLMTSSMLIAALLSHSCKKRQVLFNQDEPQDKPTEKKTILPVKIVYGKLTTEYEYFPGTARLKTIKKSTGYTYQFKYKNDTLPYIYKVLQNDKEIYEIDLIRNEAFIPIRSPRFKIEGNVYIPEGHDKLYFNESGQLIKAENYAHNNTYQSEKVFGYDINGSMISTSNTIKTPDIQHKLSYDNKNGIFKNLENTFLIYLLHQDILMATPAHNMTSCTSIQQPDDNMSLSYEYNNQNYPVKMTIIRPKWTETHLITYEEVVIE